MAIERCPAPKELCPYYTRPIPEKLAGDQDHGCFSDLDHLVPQRLGKTTLSSLYIDLPQNKVQTCRWEHEQKTYAGDLPLPDEWDMLDAVLEARENGEVHLSRKAKKRLGLL